MCVCVRARACACACAGACMQAPAPVCAFCLLPLLHLLQIFVDAYRRRSDQRACSLPSPLRQLPTQLPLSVGWPSWLRSWPCAWPRTPRSLNATPGPSHFTTGTEKPPWQSWHDVGLSLSLSLSPSLSHTLSLSLSVCLSLCVCVCGCGCGCLPPTPVHPSCHGAPAGHPGGGARRRSAWPRTPHRLSTTPGPSHSTTSTQDVQPLARTVSLSLSLSLSHTLTLSVQERGGFRVWFWCSSTSAIVVWCR
jgi:hypothetical protein